MIYRDLMIKFVTKIYFNFDTIYVYRKFYQTILKKVTYLILTINNQRPTSMDASAIAHFTFASTKTLRLIDLMSKIHISFKFKIKEKFIYLSLYTLRELNFNWFSQEFNWFFYKIKSLIYFKEKEILILL